MRQRSRMESRRRNAQMRTYVEGNTVRKVVEFPGVEEPDRKREKKSNRRSKNVARKNREKAVYMNLGYVMFLTIALFFTALTLVSYIELRSDITNKIKTISTMESTYNTMRLDNEETYKRITGSIDLEKIKTVAIGKLGMTYAKEGQIVGVENKESDYVRQLADID